MSGLPTWAIGSIVALPSTIGRAGLGFHRSADRLRPVTVLLKRDGEDRMQLNTVPRNPS
jgi:hypothetical protein